MTVPVQQWFSVVALFIMFRETVEASIICGVLLQFLARMKPMLRRAVWWGVASGVTVSIIFGVIFIAIYYTAQQNLFKGKNRDWFKGIVSYIAAALITYLGFAMLRFLGWEAKWKRKLGAQLIAKVPEVADPAVVDAEVAAGQHKPLPEHDRHHDGNPAEGAAPEAVLLNQQQQHQQEHHDDSAMAAPGTTHQQQQQPGGKDGHAADVATAAAVTKGGEAAVDASSGSGSSAAGAGKAAAAKDGSGASAADGKGELDALDVEAAAADKAPGAAAVAAGAAAEPEAHCDMTPPTRKEFWNIWVLVFTTVVREGIEAVVFLGGLGNVQLTAIPLAAFVGTVAGLGVGAFLFYSGRTVKDIKWFIIVMAVIIFFIAAGQVSIGTDALIRAGAFGYCSPWYDERPWYMVPLYDWSACCNDVDPSGTEPQNEQNTRRFFALSRAIFGYQDKGTFLEIIMYVSYWIIVVAIGAWRYWRGSLLDADYKYHRQQAKAAKEAAAKEAAEAAAADAGLLALEEAKPKGAEGGAQGGEAKALALALEGGASSSLESGSGSATESPGGAHGVAAGAAAQELAADGGGAGSGKEAGGQVPPPRADA